MERHDTKRSRNVGSGALMLATVATFLSLTACDPTPPKTYQPWNTDERREQKDQERADRMWHSGSSGGSGAHVFGATVASSGAHPDSQTGIVRGGFGKTGAMHASST